MSLTILQNQNNHLDLEYIYKALKNNTDISFTNTQIENLHNKIQLVKKMPDSFYSMKKEEDSDLSNYKFHFFKNEKSINIYMHLRGQSYPREGFAKQFSIAHCFTINNMQSEKDLSCSLSKVAYLRLNFNNERKFDAIREKFKEEIKILEKLKGKDHICQIRDAKTYSGFHLKNPYEKVIMYQDLYKSDYLDFFDEQVNIDKKKLILLSTRKRFIEGMLKALSHLKELKLTHNDITLSNIFVDEQENIYLGDFGFSENFNYANHFLNGDIRYFSPEKFNAKIDPKNAEKIDIWAVGCAFLKLFTFLEIPWAPLLFMHRKLSYLKTEYLEKSEMLIRKKRGVKIDESTLLSSAPKFYEKVQDLRALIKDTKIFLNSIKKKNGQPFEELFSTSDNLLSEMTFADEICENITDLFDFLDTPISSGASKSEKNFYESNHQLLLSFLLKEIEPFLCELETLEIVLNQIWTNLEDYLKIQQRYTYPADLALVLKMLEPDPEKRISLEEAIKLLHA